MRRPLRGKTNGEKEKGGIEMKKSTIAAAGIVTAISVAAATGLMMSGNTVKRVAQNAADTVEQTGKKMGRMVRRMM
jgi:hypothetical protein